MRLYRGLRCDYGVNQIAIDALKKTFEQTPDKDKSGIIIFDEVKLRMSVNFNYEKVKFDGYVNLGESMPDDSKHQLADHALVYIFVPLTYNWIQPVAVYASYNAAPGDILAKILLQVIQQLENAGAKVVGFTCDGSTSNKKAWKDLGISGNSRNPCNSIPHPFDFTRCLYAFTDPPHLIKCIRNNLLSHKTCQVIKCLQKISFFPFSTLIII